MKVKLTKEECEAAANTGVRRRLLSMFSGHRDHMHSGSYRDPWSIDVEGSGAEVAAAKALGINWESRVGDLVCCDLEEGVEVKWTARTSNHLLIRPRSLKPAVYVMVTGNMPNYDVRGWIWGPDIPDRYELSAGPNGGDLAYWIPPSDLTVI